MRQEVLLFVFDNSLTCWHLWPVDEALKRDLENKEWFGKQLEAFWMAKGFTTASLKKKTKLTNLTAYKDGVAPQWDKLMKIIHACNSDIIEFINFLIPGEIQKIEGIEPKSGAEVLAYKMLSTVFKCRANPRRIEGITVNLEEFSAAAQREMSAEHKEKTDLKVVKDRDGPGRKQRRPF